MSPFSTLRGRYHVIVADPPWSFKLWSQKGNRKSASRHYATMSPEAIAQLPIGDIASEHCLLLLWATGCMLPQAFRMLDAWGFTYKSEMVWCKLTKNGKSRYGTGFRVRTMHEPILLATRGNPKHKPFPSIIEGVAREHSRKPDEFYHIVRKLTPMWRRCDLFAREHHSGFKAWGDEVDKFTQRYGGKKPLALAA